MTQIDDKTRASISQHSYGFSSLVKAMQMQRGNDGRKSLRKKVGSMVSTVFCKHSKFGDEDGNGAMTKLKKNMVDDEAMTKLEKNTVDDEAMSKLKKNMVDDEAMTKLKKNTVDDEAMSKLKKMVETLHIRSESDEGGSGRKEGRRTFSKYLRKRADGDESSEVAKIGRSVKRGISEMMGGKSKSQGQGEEVWRKRILRGGKCRPLNGSGVIDYDENGVLLSDSFPSI